MSIAKTIYFPAGYTTISGSLGIKYSTTAKWSTGLITFYTPSGPVALVSILTNHHLYWAPYYNQGVQWLSGDATAVASCSNTWYVLSYSITLGINTHGSPTTTDDTITVEAFTLSVNGEEVFNYSGSYDTNLAAYSGSTSLAKINRIVISDPESGTATGDGITHAFNDTTTTQISTGYTLAPNGTGSLNEWTGTWTGTGTYANWELVDDSTTDFSDYVYTTTSGLTELYEFADTTDTASAFEVVNLVLCDTYSYVGTGVGTGYIYPLAVSSTNTDTKTNQYTGGVFTGANVTVVIFSTNPATGTTWTGAELNSAQFGFKGTP